MKVKVFNSISEISYVITLFDFDATLIHLTGKPTPDEKVKKKLKIFWNAVRTRQKLWIRRHDVFLYLVHALPD